jgi:hypothetical protein
MLARYNLLVKLACACDAGLVEPVTNFKCVRDRWILLVKATVWLFVVDGHILG